MPLKCCDKEVVVVKGRDDAFKEYLKKVQSIEDDQCWICGKTPDVIKAEFYERMKDPPEGMEHLTIDDILIMTYKTKHPLCASCYFTIKQNPGLIREVLEKPDNEIW